MPRTHTAPVHVSSPQAATQPAGPSRSPQAQPVRERLDRTSQRRVVFWDPAALDSPRQAAWRSTAAAFARDGFQTIVAGVTSTPSDFSDVACLEGPTSPDDVPVALLTDADPVATLARFGTTGSELLLADAGVHGTPTHLNHALQRLRALSWIGQWIKHWLDAIDPEVVVMVPAVLDGTARLVESMARQRRIRIATADDAAEVARLAPRRQSHLTRRPVTEACRSANEWMAHTRRRLED